MALFEIRANEAGQRRRFILFGTCGCRFFCELQIKRQEHQAIGGEAGYQNQSDGNNC
jgi:hypothetical protein